MQMIMKYPQFMLLTIILLGFNNMKCLIQGLSWALTVGRSDFSRQEN